MDEIGDIPKSVQAKILRVLQEGEFISLGDTVTKKVDVRIIAATNQDLLQRVQEKGISRRFVLSVKCNQYQDASIA